MVEESHIRRLILYVGLLPVARALWLRCLSEGGYWKTGAFWQIVFYATLSGFIASLLVDHLKWPPLSWRLKVSLLAGIISGIVLAIRLPTVHPFWPVSIVGEVGIWFLLSLLCASVAEYLLARWSMHDSQSR